MPLPEWLTQLLDVNREAGQLNDKNYERDHAAIDAKLAPYRGHRYREIPDDPRIIDCARLESLSIRLLDKYHYRWRELEAAGEIIDALFDPVIQSDGTCYALTTDVIFLNNQGHSPTLGQRSDPEEFKKYYCITVHSLRLGAFLTSYHDAVRLFYSVLTEWGFTARVTPEGTELRLERRDVCLEWISGGPIATLIVVAMLKLLAQSPQEAQSWRSI